MITLRHLVNRILVAVEFLRAGLGVRFDNIDQQLADIKAELREDHGGEFMAKLEEIVVALEALGKTT